MLPSLIKRLAATGEPRRRELIIALDLLMACVIVVFLDNWIATSLSALRQSSIAFLCTFIPNRVQLSLFFTVAMTGLIVYRKASCNPLRADQGMFVLGCGVVSGFAADILKIVFGRPRPDDSLFDITVRFNFFGGGNGFDSFPSSHAAIAAGVAGALSVIWPAHRTIYFTIAAAVAASRFVTGNHYLSDALLGFAVGLGIVVAVQMLFAQYGIPLRSKDAPGQ